MTHVAKSQVKVKPGYVVYHEGESYGPGQVFTLPSVDARRLMEQGVVERDA